jgi:hypothetical protein
MMTLKPRTIALAALALAAAGSAASAQTLIGTWAGNGHSYYRVSTATTWTNARDAAAAFGATLPGSPLSYLVTITSAAEQAQLNTWLPQQSNPVFWMGLERQGPVGTDNYGWITGEARTYSNWAGDAFPNTNPGQYGSWNWNVGGLWIPLDNTATPFGGKQYIIEVVPAPSAAALLGLGGLLAARRRR